MLENKQLPPIVYKYRNWKDQCNKDVLQKNHLFFTSPKEFNDPFDCKIPDDYSLLDTEENIQKYKDLKRQELESALPPDELERTVESHVKELRINPSKIQEKANSFEFKATEEYFGILSLSKRWCSILMWSHYANSHQGFCVGFWEEKLRNNISVLEGGQVCYPPDNSFPRPDPIGNPKENMIHKYLTKSNEWGYEEEYRMVKLFFEENPPKIPTIENRITAFPDDCIAEIIIGLEASEQAKSEILQMAKDKRKPVYQCIKKPFKFELDRKQIL